MNPGSGFMTWHWISLSDPGSRMYGRALMLFAATCLFWPVPGGLQTKKESGYLSHSLTAQANNQGVYSLTKTGIPLP